MNRSSKRNIATVAVIAAIAGVASITAASAADDGGVTTREIEDVVAGYEDTITGLESRLDRSEEAIRALHEEVHPAQEVTDTMSIPVQDGVTHSASCPDGESLLGHEAEFYHQHGYVSSSPWGVTEVSSAQDGDSGWAVVYNREYKVNAIGTVYSKITLTCQVPLDL